MNPSRRLFVSGLASLPLLPALLRAKPSPDRPIERVIFVYHPDGAYLRQWHPEQAPGPITQWSLSLDSLRPFRDQLILLRQLNILDGRGDGHPEPASYLLTGGRSQFHGTLDVQLAEYFEKPLIHLGVQASKYNGESISYLSGGSQKIADDSPLSARRRLFGREQEVPATDPAIFNQVKQEISAIADRLSDSERNKLTQHLNQLQIIQRETGQCQASLENLDEYREDLKHQDHAVPLIFRLQMDIIVQALACGLSPVATLQLSRNTSPMKMDFDWLDRWDDRWSMESHQASHNDAEIHGQQKRWINHQLAYLLTRLASLPEPNPSKSGSMLDHSLVYVMTEVANGASHTRNDVPFYLVGGRGSGWLRSGQVVDCQNASHASLLHSIAYLLGMPAREPYANAGALAQIFHSR